MNRVAVVHCLIMVASVFAKRRRCHLTLSLVEGEVLEQCAEYEVPALNRVPALAWYPL